MMRSVTAQRRHFPAAGGNVVLAGSGNAWQDADGDLKSGYAIAIRRVRPLTQTTDIRNQGSFYPASHEDAFDHTMMVHQQQQDEIDRSLKLGESEDGTVDLTAIPFDRANTVLGFDADKKPKVYSPASAVTDAESVNFLQDGAQQSAGTVGRRLSHSISPDDEPYGAVSGATDNYAEIQASLDAVREGGLWILPDGEWRTSATLKFRTRATYIFYGEILPYGAFNDYLCDFGKGTTVESPGPAGPGNRLTRMDVLGMNLDCEDQSRGFKTHRIDNSTFNYCRVDKVCGTALRSTVTRECSFTNLFIWYGADIGTLTAASRNTEALLDLEDRLDPAAGFGDPNNKIDFFNINLSYCGATTYINARTKSGTAAVRDIRFHGGQVHYLDDFDITNTVDYPRYGSSVSRGDDAAVVLIDIGISQRVTFDKTLINYPGKAGKMVRIGRAVTDLAIDAVTNTDVTSASYTFTSDDIGKVFAITAGAGFTTGIYSVSSIPSAGKARLNAAAGVVGSTGGTGRFDVAQYPTFNECFTNNSYSGGTAIGFEINYAADPDIDGSYPIIWNGTGTEATFIGNYIRDTGGYLGSHHFGRMWIRRLIAGAGIILDGTNASGTTSPSVYMIAPGGRTATMRRDNTSILNFIVDYGTGTSRTLSADFDQTGGISIYSSGDLGLAIGKNGARLRALFMGGLDAEPSDKLNGMVAWADRSTWDPLSRGAGEPYPLFYMNRWRALDGDRGITTVGDANATFDRNSIYRTLRYNTALTANRTITLSTTNMQNGEKLRVVRTSAATGAFNLDVGGLKTLTAASQWCDVEFNGTAWILVANGTL